MSHHSALRSPDPLRQPPQPRHSIEGEVHPENSNASSIASGVTTIPVAQIPSGRSACGIDAVGGRPSLTSSAAIPTTCSGAPLTISRLSSDPLMSQSELPTRKQPGRGAAADAQQRNRSRHHSQGFFEPTLPTASTSDAAIPASRIAAQAAMQHQQATPHYVSKRPQTTSQNPEDISRNRRRGSDSSSPPPPPSVPAVPVPGLQPQQPNHLNGVGGHTNAAATAANLVYSKNMTIDYVSEREHRPKAEKSKMKLFSKPKHIGISRDRELKEKGTPSPSRMGFSGGGSLVRIVSASSTGLTELQAPQSMYSLPDGSSTSTVVAYDRQAGEREKEKDKSHKHHFLSRQKLKLKDREEHYNLPLSSASSNSKPSDPRAPQSLYSFAPASPGSAAFGKSVSGLDILHGGRALREKKKEERALAESDQFESTVSGTPAVFAVTSPLGGSTSILGESALRETLQGFGLHNMTPDDAWDFLKAKLLVIFDGEDVRIAIEDLNKLVLVHIQRCVQKRTPAAIISDLRELLGTGFASLNQGLNGIPDEKLVPHLVHIWMLVFGTILPFIQAVFLPLDLEFKGCGSVLSVCEASEFWGPAKRNTSGSGLDVRNLALVAFRDTIILFRYETMKGIFSRLSLDSINLDASAASPRAKNNSTGRPGTATSLDAGTSSYSSQSSTLFNTGGSYSSDSISCSRSRAASNTSSNPDQLIFQTISSSSQRSANNGSLQADTPHVISETMGRMLQCISVLASVQTGDEAQEQVETLLRALKHNWLGRGRTGRDRRGFVGAKVRTTAATRAKNDGSKEETQGYGPERKSESDWTAAPASRQRSSEVSVS